MKDLSTNPNKTLQKLDRWTLSPVVCQKAQYTDEKERNKIPRVICDETKLNRKRKRGVVLVDIFFLFWTSFDEPFSSNSWKQSPLCESISKGSLLGYLYQSRFCLDDLLAKRSG